MNYKIGERVIWRSLNRHYTGEVTAIQGIFAVVRIDGTEKSVLLQNKPTNGKRIKDYNDSGTGGVDETPLQAHEEC